MQGAYGLWNGRMLLSCKYYSVWGVLNSEISRPYPANCLSAFANALAGTTESLSTNWPQPPS